MATYAGLGAATAVFSFGLSFALRQEHDSFAAPFNPADPLLLKCFNLDCWPSHVQNRFICGSSVSHILL